MRIRMIDLQEFVDEANKLSTDATALERGIFVSPHTRTESRMNGIMTRVSREIVASFSPDCGQNIVTYEIDLGLKDFMDVPKDKEAFGIFTDQHQEKLDDLKQHLTNHCPHSRIYAGTLES